VALAPTSGRVMFRGNPVANCRVTFTPVGAELAGGRAATAVTAADGTFTLVTDDRPGAMVGEHAVFVGSEDANAPLPGDAPRDMRFTVVAGPNECPIDLTAR